MVGSGEYLVLGLIGKGGFGEVYKARYTGEGGFSRIVALKILKPARIAGREIQQISSRLRDEARLLGLLHHQNIVHVDRLVRLNGLWTIVMEYVEGLNLKQLMAFEQIPAPCALKIAKDVALALHTAHTAHGLDGRPLGLLHRDIKPANIQITIHGGVKVLDFGIAKACFSQREAKSENLLMGTRRFMAPERAWNVDTPAGDIYSLGLVLLQMLTHGSSARLGPLTCNCPADKGRIEKLLGVGARELLHPGLVELLAGMLNAEHQERPTAQEFVRRCETIRRELQGPPFNDWATSRVKDILSRLEPLPKSEMEGVYLSAEYADSQNSLIHQPALAGSSPNWRNDGAGNPVYPREQDTSDQDTTAKGPPPTTFSRIGPNRVEQPGSPEMSSHRDESPASESTGDSAGYHHPPRSQQEHPPARATLHEEGPAVMGSTGSNARFPHVWPVLFFILAMLALSLVFILYYHRSDESLVHLQAPGTPGLTRQEPSTASTGRSIPTGTQVLETRGGDSPGPQPAAAPHSRASLVSSPKTSPAPTVQGKDREAAHSAGASSSAKESSSRVDAPTSPAAIETKTASRTKQTEPGAGSSLEGAHSQDPASSTSTRDYTAPEALPPNQSLVKVTGGATSVLLKGASGKEYTGNSFVPPGSYKGLAYFKEFPEPVEFSFRVNAGIDITVHCDAVFVSCDVE